MINMEPSTPSLRDLAQDKSPLPPPPSRPTPIRIPDGAENNKLMNSSTPSPRAALVAGLRSATDRRQREKERDQRPKIAHATPPASPASSLGASSAGMTDNGIYAALYAKQQELLATSMLISQQQQRIQAAMSSAAAAYGLQTGGMSPSLNPSTGGSTTGNLSNLDSLDSLTGSMASFDIGSYANFPPPPNFGGYNSGGSSNSGFGHQRTSSGNKYSAAFSPSASPAPSISSGPPAIYSHGYSNSFSGVESNNFSDYAPEFSPLYQQQRLTNQFSGSGSPQSHPPGLFNRPSSPSLPVRPQSSSSFRSSLFFNSSTDSNQGANLHPNQNYSQNQNQNQNQNPLVTTSYSQYQSYGRPLSPSLNSFSSSASPNLITTSNSNNSSPSFRRGHRKASSLSTSTVYGGGSKPSNSSAGVIGSGNYTFGSGGFGSRASSGLSGNRSAAGGDYEIPWRQPIGPPSLDEIKQRHRDLNFARRVK